MEFARRGARIAVADINQAGADETAQLIKAVGGDAIGIACNVTSEDSVRNAVDAAEQGAQPPIDNVEVRPNFL